MISADAGNGDDGNNDDDEDEDEDEDEVAGEAWSLDGGNSVDLEDASTDALSAAAAEDDDPAIGKLAGALL